MNYYGIPLHVLDEGVYAVNVNDLPAEERAMLDKHYMLRVSGVTYVVYSHFYNTFLKVYESNRNLS